MRHQTCRRSGRSVPHGFARLTCVASATAALCSTSSASRPFQVRDQLNAAADNGLVQVNREVEHGGWLFETPGSIGPTSRKVNLALQGIINDMARLETRYVLEIDESAGDSHGNLIAKGRGLPDGQTEAACWSPATISKSDRARCKRLPKTPAAPGVPRLRHRAANRRANLDAEPGVQSPGGQQGDHNRRPAAARSEPRRAPRWRSAIIGQGQHRRAGKIRQRKPG